MSDYYIIDPNDLPEIAEALGVDPGALAEILLRWDRASEVGA